MWILGVETSGKSGEVALWRDDAPVESRSLSSAGQRHAQALVKEINDLLDRHELTATDIDLVAVSIGPGSFTGLRVGVVFAKTFCYATKAKLVAVDTMRAIAENCPPDVHQVYVLADAQRGDVYVGEYVRGDQGEFHRRGDVSIRKLEEFSRARESANHVTGPVLERYAQALEGRCHVLPNTLWHPRAETIARIGRAMAEGGELADLWQLEPFYIRKSAAEEKLDRQPAEPPAGP